MRIFLIGAGQVGFEIVEALHHDHEVTVLDTEPSRLAAMAQRYDVATFEGDGTSRRDLANAGVQNSDLVIACTSRDEVNLVAGMFARREAKGATTVIRTSNVEYVELARRAAGRRLRRLLRARERPTRSAGSSACRGAPD